MPTHLRRSALIVGVCTIVPAFVKLDFSPLTEVRLELDLKFIYRHLFLKSRFSVKRYVLQAEYTLKHLLLTLE